MKLADDDFNRRDLRVHEDLLGDSRCYPFEQHVALVSDDALDGADWFAVVDRGTQVVGGTGLTDIGVDVDVHLKRLRTDAFLVESTDNANYPKSSDLNAIHGR